MTKYIGCRGEQLPPKFTTAERAAYVWLWDCGIRPWLVDFVSKRVTTPDATFASLVAYRTHIEIGATMTPLPDRLRELAEAVAACEWELPIDAVETLNEAAEALSLLTTAVDAWECGQMVWDAEGHLLADYKAACLPRAWYERAKGTAT